MLDLVPLSSIRTACAGSQWDQRWPKLSAQRAESRLRSWRSASWRVALYHNSPDLMTEIYELLRTNINREARSPRTVAELVAHYTRNELAEDGSKAYSTREVYGSYIRTWILPTWGTQQLSDVKTVAVEAWLASLSLANGSKAKIRNVMSAIFTHAMRYEWLNRNPITLVRQSAKRERLPDVLTAEEIGALLMELPEPCRTAVLLASCTGLRVSELLALKWSDVHFNKGEICPCRAIVDQVVGNLKTEASGKAVPM